MIEISLKQANPTDIRIKFHQGKHVTEVKGSGCFLITNRTLRGTQIKVAISSGKGVYKTVRCDIKHPLN